MFVSHASKDLEEEWGKMEGKRWKGVVGAWWGS